MSTSEWDFVIQFNYWTSSLLFYLKFALVTMAGLLQLRSDPIMSVSLCVRGRVYSLFDAGELCQKFVLDWRSVSENSSRFSCERVYSLASVNTERVQAVKTAIRSSPTGHLSSVLSSITHVWRLLCAYVLILSLLSNHIRSERQECFSGKRSGEAGRERPTAGQLLLLVAIKMN